MYHVDGHVTNGFHCFASVSSQISFNHRFNLANLAKRNNNNKTIGKRKLITVLMTLLKWFPLSKSSLHLSKKLIEPWQSGNHLRKVNSTFRLSLNGTLIKVLFT